MRLFELLEEILQSESIVYTQQDGTIQFATVCGGHKWQVAFTEDKESFLKYYARYPWTVEEKNEPRVLRALNALNSTLRAGCFMIYDGYPVFRYGVYIFDEFTARESIADLLLTAAAKTEAAWEDVYYAVFSWEE